MLYLQANASIDGNYSPLEKKKSIKCKICDLELPDKEHLERHYEVHRRQKSKPVPYGDPYFPLPMWSANVDGALTPLARVLFGKTEDDLNRKKKKEKSKS